MSAGSQSTTTTSTPYYLPGQEAFTPKFAAPLEDIFSGNLNNPTASAMTGLSKNAADTSANQQRLQIGGMTNLSSPARAQLIKQLSNQSIQSSAAVPGNVWQSAFGALSQYALQAPAVGQSSQGGGYSGGACWVWTFFDGKHGDVTEMMRKYRDRRFGKGSEVDVGYKKIGKVVLPLMRKSKLLQLFIYLTVFIPLSAVGRGTKNPLFHLYAWFWTLIFKKVGQGQGLTQIVGEEE